MADATDPVAEARREIMRLRAKLGEQATVIDAARDEVAAHDIEFKGQCDCGLCMAVNVYDALRALCDDCVMHCDR